MGVFQIGAYWSFADKISSSLLYSIKISVNQTHQNPHFSQNPHWQPPPPVNGVESGSKVALITGITGQDGSYLTELLLSKGYSVHGLIRKSSNFNTQRINHIYIDPHNAHKARMKLHYADLTDASSLRRWIDTIAPDEIYNLAAQSHVVVSFEIPDHTADDVATGSLRLLEALRSHISSTGSLRFSHIVHLLDFMRNYFDFDCGL